MASASNTTSNRHNASPIATLADDGTVFEVVVIGSGLAGLTAAVRAAQSGASVLVLEKEARFGGNSAKATSGINMMSTPVKQRVASNDSKTAFLRDTLRSAGRDTPLQRRLVDGAASARAFLDMIGVRWIDVVRCGGHSHARTHRVCAGRDRPNNKARNAGRELIDAALTAAQRHLTDRITLKSGERVVQLLQNLLTDAVDCVLAQDVASGQQRAYRAKCGVVLATGGFCGNLAALRRIAPASRAAGMKSTTNGAFAEGDGLVLGQALGGDVVDLDSVQLHPTGLVDPVEPDAAHKILAPEALRGHGALLLDPSTGRRFVDELETRDVVTAAILALPLKRAVLVLPPATVAAFGEPLVQFYASRGLLRRADDATHLAALLGVEDVGAAQGVPLYYANVEPVAHYCHGGLRIDTSARVLDTSGNPIPRLFGAGEVTGGVHGMNRLAGNSLLECVVFGLLAGDGAAATPIRS